MPRAGTRWLNSTVLGIGLASLFSDWSHEIATAAMPAFLASLGLERLKVSRTGSLHSRRWLPASTRINSPAANRLLLPVISARRSQRHLSPSPTKLGTCYWRGRPAGSAADSAHQYEKRCWLLPSLLKPTAGPSGSSVRWTPPELSSVR